MAYLLRPRGVPRERQQANAMDAHAHAHEYEPEMDSEPENENDFASQNQNGTENEPLSPGIIAKPLWREDNANSYIPKIWRIGIFGLIGAQTLSKIFKNETIAPSYYMLMSTEYMAFFFKEGARYIADIANIWPKLYPMMRFLIEDIGMNIIRSIYDISYGFLRFLLVPPFDFIQSLFTNVLGEELVGHSMNTIVQLLMIFGVIIPGILSLICITEYLFVILDKRMLIFGYARPSTLIVGGYINSLYSIVWETYYGASWIARLCVNFWKDLCKFISYYVEPYVRPVVTIVKRGYELLKPIAKYIPELPYYAIKNGFNAATSGIDAIPKRSMIAVVSVGILAVGIFWSFS
jgi:hypothetical protein